MSDVSQANELEQPHMVDVIKTIEEYIHQNDWRVKANANQGFSLGGLILNTAGKITANYWLNKIYPSEVSDAHISGDLHIHDIDFFCGYCAGWSLKSFLATGLNGVGGKIESGPPKHLSSAVGQMINFIGTMQNEWAGAQSFSSFDTYLAPLIRKDNLTYKEIRQFMQEFVFNLNVPSRWGNQSPFTNLTFDLVCPDDIKDERPMIGGETLDFTYGELQPEMDLINHAFIDVMVKGDFKGRVFTFPIPTYNITKDFDWDSEISNKIFAMTAKYGIPYFQNFINSDLEPSMVRSMCCRLSLRLDELSNKGNGLFGSGEQTGSIGVVTINAARLGYIYKTEEELLARLSKLMDLAKISLEIKRETVEGLIERGFLPFTKRYLGNLRNHFSTIGINGVNECVRNFTNDEHDITTSYGKKLAEKILDFMREKITEIQKDTGHMYNIEATPAEGACYRFAREDKKRFDGIIQEGSADAPYYTNSTQLPVNFTSDLLYTLEHQESLQQKYTGGTVLHLYAAEKIPDGEICKKIIKSTFTNYRIPYITITPTFSICNIHGYISGEQYKCPECGEPCEVWSRIVGYMRPVSEWNDGKKMEFKDRLKFNYRKAIE